MAKLSKKKMLLFLFWSLIGTVVVVLSVKAMSGQREKTCSGYTIEIVEGGNQFFIDKKDVVAILNNDGAKVIKGRSLSSFDLRAMENKLETNPWIRDAQLFFDNNGQLNVLITEAEPIARIFTTSGNSFYIDSALERLPLSNIQSPKLPLFTGFPSDKPRLNSKDSALMADIKTLSNYLAKDKFWYAQIAQVDITSDRKFEMIPTIGSHVIEFGNGQDYEKKFRRLMIFYRDVLTQTGMNTYSRINVQFDRQVIGVRGGSTAPSISMPLLNTEKPPIDSRPASVRNKPTGTKKNPPSKSQSYEAQAKPATTTPGATDNKPKAVMPKRNAH